MSFEKSVELFKVGNFEQSLALINDCIARDRSNIEFLAFRARVHSRLGDFESALEDFNAVCGLEPYNPSFINDRAVVLHLLKRDVEALAEFDRAANLDPSNAYRFASRAFFKDRIGDLKGALEDYEKAIELDPEDAVSHNNKGILEEKMGYVDKSKKSFGTADGLVGYKVPENIIPISSENKSETENTGNAMLPNLEKPKKLSVRNFIETLNKLASNKETQQEFLHFVKKKIGIIK